MIAFLSPAVNLVPTALPGMIPTTPPFSREAVRLAGELRQYSPWELESLLGVNPRLALSAFDSYQTFGGEGEPTPVLPSFRGLAYQSMNPGDFTPEDYAYAAGHLRLLSALYGLLLPGDGVWPYRLDFLCRYARAHDGGRGLYRFWGDRVCRQLFRSDDLAINLSSGEYAKLILPHVPRGKRVISCRFLVHRRGKLTCLATASKMCRGLMVRHIVKNRIDSPEDLKGFEQDDFVYNPDLSTPEQYIFVQGS